MVGAAGTCSSFVVPINRLTGDVGTVVGRARGGGERSGVALAAWAETSLSCRPLSKHAGQASCHPQRILSADNVVILDDDARP
jgi:hypothetical protein